MLARMSRIDIVAPRALAPSALRAIHRAGTVHLEPYDAPPGLGPAVFAVDPDPAAISAFDTAAGRLGELGALLGPAEPAAAAIAELWELPDTELVERIGALEPVRRTAAGLDAERSRLDGDIARLESYRRLIASLRAVVGRLPALRGYASTGIVVASRYRSVVPLLREELEALTDGRCEVIAADIDGDRVAAILLYPTRLTPEVRSLLGGRDIEDVSLPDDLAGVPFDELEPRLRFETERMAAARAAALAALRELAAAHGRTVAGLSAVVADRVAERRALAAAATSDHLVVLTGWIPTLAIDALRAELERAVGPAVAVVERQRPDRPPPAPVALVNARLFAPFGPLTSFVGLPRYGTIDPTPILALTFPAFVGLMVGDAGYGLVLLVALLLARWRWPRAGWVRVAFPVGLTIAAATIAFGILFGEWFGSAGEAVGLKPVLVDRAEAVALLLALTLTIGVVHVGLGLVLGVVNAMLLRHGREAAARVALLVTLASVVVALLAAAEVLPAGLLPFAVAAIVVAVLVATVSVGIAGPIEVVGVIGNVLSYARLMAIGLASVMLALVANRLGGLIENALLGILVAGALHALNIGLGFFDASIQGLRLHYVEFFGRFVEAGGVRYEPFVSVLGSGASLPGSPTSGGS